MGSRRSLRLQIVVILLIVLGAEALLSSLWLLLVMPHTLKVEGEKIATSVLEAASANLHNRCPEPITPECARPYIDTLQRSGYFRGVRLAREAGSGPVLDMPEGQPLGPPDVRVKAGNGLALEAWLELRETRARASQLFQFHLVNLFVAVVGLLLLGMLLFDRVVSRPVEQLAAVADRIGNFELEGLADGQSAPVLGQLSLSFERMARALKREQDRVKGQIDELTRMNKDLKDARDAVVRQEKLATVGRLAAGVAHEVGNPLGGILGYAELLKTRDEPTVKDYAERIEREVARIDRTVRGLLDFSRPSQAELAPLSLSASIQRALSLCQADKRFREVEPVVEVPAELQVLADEHRLGQVLVNLLLNAGDAMQGKGKVTLRATVHEDEAKHRRASDPPPGRRVELVVEDTGPGIPADVLPRIFDPFFTTKEVGQGTGLGLSISASIMEAFGGELRAENRAEGGARFWVVLRAA